MKWGEHYMKLSLGRKIVIIVTLTAVIISVTCVTVSSIVFRKIMDNEYVITADSMAATVAGTIDGDKLQPLTEKIMAIYKADGNKISNEETDDPGFEDYAAQYLDIMNDQNYIDVQKFMRPSVSIWKTKLLFISLTQLMTMNS